VLCKKLSGELALADSEDLKLEFSSLNTRPVCLFVFDHCGFVRRYLSLPLKYLLFYYLPEGY